MTDDAGTAAREVLGVAASDGPEAAARAVLGVAATDGPDAVRAAYRRKLRGHHPDLVGAAGNEATREIVAAYETLSAGAARQRAETVESETVESETVDPPTVDPPTVDFETVESEIADADTLVIALPAHETFLVLLEAAYRIGDVTYVDREGELIEVLVVTDDGTTASLVISLQGRAAATEAFFTLEPLAYRNRPSLPPIGEMVARFAAELLGA